MAAGLYHRLRVLVIHRMVFKKHNDLKLLQINFAYLSLTSVVPFQSHPN